MLGGGPAASADDPHSGQEETARVLRHVLGRAEIQIAAFDGGRQAGIGHGAERLGGVADHFLDGFEHHLRTGRTVQADHVHRQIVQAAGEIESSGAVAQVAVILDAQQSHDDQIVTGGLARGQDGFANFIRIAKRFENEEVDAGFDQRIRLLAEHGAGFVEAGGTERLQSDAQRTNGAGHEGLLARGFAGDPHAGLIDQADLFGETIRRQTLTIGTESIGFKNLRASLDVFLVNVANQGGQRQVQLVVAAIDEHAFGVERGSHGAIGHQDASF